MIHHIIIADDHSLILDGFEQTVLKYLPGARISKAKDKSTLFELLATTPADVLFQDIKFGKHDARDFIKEIKDKYPTLKIVIISTLADEQTVNAMLKQGIDGYISKTDDSTEVLNVFEKLITNERYLSSGVRKTGTHHTPAQQVFLTARERQVLSHIINGKTTKEIGSIMCLSDKTIEIHRSNLFIKFDVKNVAILVKKAIYEGYS